jgi:hypothetical protein
MRVLCVGRHQFLSEHLCRYFGQLGAQCEGAVGIGDAIGAADAFEPHLVIAECDLLVPSALDDWSASSGLRDVPVLAVSLTRRPEECLPADVSGLAGVIFLPALQRNDALSLLELARRPRGVEIPPGATMGADRISATTR